MAPLPSTRHVALVRSLLALAALAGVCPAAAPEFRRFHDVAQPCRLPAHASELADVWAMVVLGGGE